MAGKGKRSKPEKRAKARIGTKGLRVSAVKTTAGRSATSVHVEVAPEELKGEVGEFGDVRRVSASIPEDDAKRPGHVRWTKENLQPAGTEEREVEGKRQTVKSYFNVHYGPARTEEFGVGVQVDTDACRVNAPRPGHRYTVKAESQPGESEIKKRK